MKPLVSHLPWIGLATVAFVGGWQMRVSSSEPVGLPSMGSVRPVREQSGAKAGLDQLPFPKTGAVGEVSTDAGTLPGRGMRQLVDEISMSDDPLRQEMLFARLLAGMSATNAKATWEALRSCSDGNPDANRRLELFGYAWGRLRGARAMEVATSGEAPADRTLARAAIEGWAAAEPEAATAYMQSEMSAPAPSCRLGFLKGLARSRPDTAAEYLVGLDDFTDAGPYIRPVIDAQLRVGHEHARQWVMNLSSGKLKEQGLQILVERLVRTAPREAAAWVSSFADDSLSKDSVATVAEYFMKEPGNEHQDLRFALDWMDGLPDGEAKNAAYAKSIRTWARRDPNAAAGFLMEMAPSPVKDDALRGFSLELALKDSSAAVQWAATIGDADLRHRTLTATVRQWFLWEPDAAQAWLESANLPEETLWSITTGQPN
jgi:hypothetical protein